MRVLIVHLALLSTIVSFTGCKSTFHMESKRHLQRFKGDAQSVYVTNPELHREYDILRNSGIYQLATQPDGAMKLTLRPLTHYGKCANPLMLSALTLGIVPGFLPGASVFAYDLESNGVTERYAHHLPIYERFSVWEHLVRSNEQEVFTEALAWSTRGRPLRPL